MKTTIRLALACMVLTLCACKTYYIPVADFRHMFAGKEKTRTVETSSPFGGTTTYKTYAIDSIKCQDKKGNPMQLKNGPFIEMRVTRMNNRKTVLFFDLIDVTDSTVTGSKSRIISSLKKTIKISDIKKIEVQNGGKKYRYMNIRDNE